MLLIMTSILLNGKLLNQSKGERTTKVLLQAGLTLLSSAAARYQLQSQQDKHLWAFVCYLLLLYLYSSAVGGGHSNEFPACSNTRTLGAISSRYSKRIVMLLYNLLTYPLRNCKSLLPFPCHHRQY